MVCVILDQFVRYSYYLFDILNEVAKTMLFDSYTINPSNGRFVTLNNMKMRLDTMMYWVTSPSHEG